MQALWVRTCLLCVSAKYTTPKAAPLVEARSFALVLGCGSEEDCAPVVSVYLVSVKCASLDVFGLVRFSVDELATPGICSLFQCADSDRCPGYSIR